MDKGLRSVIEHWDLLTEDEKMLIVHRVVMCQAVEQSKVITLPRKQKLQHRRRWWTITIAGAVTMMGAYGAAHIIGNPILDPFVVGIPLGMAVGLVELAVKEYRPIIIGG